MGEASVEILQWIWRKKGKPFVDDEERWTIPVSVIGVILVIVGVGGEAYFEMKQATAETAVREYDERVLGTTADAAERAKGAADGADKVAKAAKGTADAANFSAGEAVTAAGKSQETADNVGEKADRVQGEVASAKADLATTKADEEKVRANLSEAESKLRLVQVQAARAEASLRAAIAYHARSRELPEFFLRLAKIEPPATAVIWCKDTDAEAWIFASETREALLIARWNVGPIIGISGNRFNGIDLGIFGTSISNNHVGRNRDGTVFPMHNSNNLEASATALTGSDVQLALLFQGLNADVLIKDPSLPEKTYRIVIASRDQTDFVPDR